jgi:hypothetical protein
MRQHLVNIWDGTTSAVIVAMVETATTIDAVVAPLVMTVVIVTAVALALEVLLVAVLVLGPLHVVGPPTAEMIAEAMIDVALARVKKTIKNYSGRDCASRIDDTYSFLVIILSLHCDVASSEIGILCWFGMWTGLFMTECEILKPGKYL